ncbi:uncharacterized protein LOC133711128 [Rosa rugosa]|uniref:uncharacterized protein LOC133711128 n=1 Tax=Rosa rugosa TaxID=74645 RepID=UPI002B4092A3|nr:uncharacterized protein LOC133711128 [Rosa rugosa]
MDRYQRVEKPRAETPVDENEIRITSCTYHIYYIPPSIINDLIGGPHDMASPAYGMHPVGRHPSYFVMVEIGRYLVGRPPSHAPQEASREAICTLYPTSRSVFFNRNTSQGRMRNYITYAMTLLQNKGSNEIVFKAMGRAINKSVTIVELIKIRIVGLHQYTTIGSTDITDTWEPLEEGLLPWCVL